MKGLLVLLSRNRGLGYSADIMPAKSLYSVHPGVLMTQKWVATLKEKSGRSLEEWLKLVKKNGPPTEKERR